MRVRGGLRLSPRSLAPLLAAVFFALLLALPAAAEQNVTITLPPPPSITPPAGSTASVTAELRGGKLLIHYVCYYIGSPCPAVEYNVTAGNVTVYHSIVEPPSACSNGICAYTLAIDVSGVNASRIVVRWRPANSTRTYVIIVSRSPGGQAASTIFSLIPFAVLAGFILRGDVRAAAYGALVAAAVIYILGATGVAPMNPVIVNIAIALGAILVWITR